MAEILTLTTPEIGATEYDPIEFTVNIRRGSLSITFASNIGTTAVYHEQDADTPAAIRALNKANLSVKSLRQHLIERAVSKGFKVGTVTGTPD